MYQMKMIKQTLLFLFAFGSFANGEVTYKFNYHEYFCEKTYPQTQMIINIDQLMGAWYSMEIISHTEYKKYDHISSSCPIIHILDDQEFNPNHYNFDYNTKYDLGSPSNVRSMHFPGQYGDENPNVLNNPINFDDGFPNTRSNYPDDINNRNVYPKTGMKHYGQNDYLRRIQEYFIKLLWNEYNNLTEYRLKFNADNRGIWKGAPPQYGPTFDEVKVSKFVGAIHVVKATDNYLVLTFCEQMPQTRFFTVILSRNKYLDEDEEEKVQYLLRRKGFPTHAITKTCNSGNRLKGLIVFILLLFTIHAF